MTNIFGNTTGGPREGEIGFPKSKNIPFYI